MYCEARVKSFVAASAVSARRRVKYTANGVEHCTSADKGIGFAVSDMDTGETVGVALDNANGTHEAVAAVAIAAGATVYAAAAGRLAATGSVAVGTALSAATAEGDILEVLI